MLLPAMNGLPEIIRREMELCGFIPFARFMELSLYCPQLGYYEQIANTPGRRGDFFTSVTVGPLVGQTKRSHRSTGQSLGSIPGRGWRRPACAELSFPTNYWTPCRSIASAGTRKTRPGSNGASARTAANSCGRNCR